MEDSDYKIYRFEQDLLAKYSKSWFTKNQFNKLRKDISQLLDGSFNVKEILKQDGYLFFDWKNMDPNNSDEIFIGYVAWVYINSILKILMQLNPGKITAFDKSIIEFSKNNANFLLEKLSREIVTNVYCYFDLDNFFKPSVKNVESSLREIKFALIQFLADEMASNGDKTPFI